MGGSHYGNMSKIFHFPAEKYGGRGFLAEIAYLTNHYKDWPTEEVPIFQ
jgi:hypothetical protein